MKVQEHTEEQVLQQIQDRVNAVKKIYEGTNLTQPSENGRKMISKMQELLDIDKNLEWEATLKVIEQNPDIEKVKQAWIEALKSL